MKRLRIALFGYGAVAKAFHQILASDRERLRAAHGIDPAVVAIVRSGGAWFDAHGLAPGGDVLARRKPGVAADIAASVDCDLVVDLTPTDLATGGVGLVVTRRALGRGIPVVTANKGPLVVAYRELMDLARSKGVPFLFEGSVAGAIPTLNLHDRCLPGNRVTRVDGILNGTSNFILTRMAEEGLGFEPALEEARELGYAEADPSADVDGHDAAAKVVILANHVLGRDLSLKDVATTGIRSVSGAAMRLARERGYAIRLIASVARDGQAEVAPKLVPRTSELNVNGTLNVVRYTTEHAGAFTLVGKGAGGRETATAVLSDVIQATSSQGARGQPS